MGSALYTLCRIARWPECVQVIVDAGILYYLPKLLESPQAQVRHWTCRILGHIALHNSLVVAILRLKPCAQLVSMLRQVAGFLHRARFSTSRIISDEDSKVTENSLYALSSITQWPDGAQAALDAQMLDYLAELLASPNPQVRRWTCRILGHLALQRSIAMAILSLDTCAPLLSLLR